MGNEIPKEYAKVDKQDYAAVFRDCSREEQMQERLTVRCTTCGAETTLATNVTAERCPFCGSGIVAQGTSKKLIKPNSLLPFAVTHDQSSGQFRAWIASLWFAPNELQRRAETSQIAGVYIPAWTYDSNTTSNYTGERGDD